jgi:hypothetical protein
LLYTVEYDQPVKVAIHDPLRFLYDMLPADAGDTFEGRTPVRRASAVHLADRLFNVFVDRIQIVPVLNVGEGHTGKEGEAESGEG